MSERGALLVRFQVDPREQRLLARVRAIAALLAAPAALAMLLGELPWPVFLVAVLALLLSLAWLGQARRLWRASKREPDALFVHAGGIELREAGQSTWLAWAEVERVEVDEERLEVVITRHVAPALRIEPRYPGVDIYELVRTLDHARFSAPGR